MCFLIWFEQKPCGEAANLRMMRIMNSASQSPPRRTTLIALVVVALPFMMIPLSPVISAAIGVASAHLWLFNLPRNSISDALQAPANWAVATSGLGWLMAGMILLANLH
jgi:hypothetical protein